MRFEFLKIIFLMKYSLKIWNLFCIENYWFSKLDLVISFLEYFFRKDENLRIFMCIFFDLIVRFSI